MALLSLVQLHIAEEQRRLDPQVSWSNTTWEKNYYKVKRCNGNNKQIMYGHLLQE
jgi:hypothetical protein